MAHNLVTSSDFLIIGCTSEIGSGVLKNLLSLGYRVDGIRYMSACNLRNENHRCVSMDLLSANLDDLPSIFNPKILVLASWYTEHGQFWESSLNTKWFEMYKKLCQKFSASGTKGIVGFGSCAEYSWEGNLRISELSETSPKSLYGVEKLRLFKWLNTEFQNLLWVRPFFVFGPADHPTKLIKSALISKKNMSSVRIINSNDSIDYIYIEDVIELSTKLILIQARGVFNLGTGRPLTSVEIMDVVGCDYELGINHEGLSPKFVVANNEKVTRLLGPIDWTSLERGVSNMLNSEDFSLIDNGGKSDQV